MSTTTDMDELVRRVCEDRAHAWEEARVRVVHWLDRQIGEIVEDDGDESRLSVSWRIKERPRIVEKLRRKLDPDARASLDAAGVEAALGDIVGVKVCAKTLADQQRMCERLEAVPEEIGLIDEHDDYVKEPKPSGYRGTHFVLLLAVPGGGEVRVEVQVKTRLQDSWGEMTHEDLYKPGAAVQPTAAHTRRARIMADLLAAVDELATDLAEEIAEQISGPDGESAAAESVHTDRVTATIRTTGPRYALAIDEYGRQGLIPARAVREALGRDDFIRVSQHVKVGERWTATVRADAKGTYFFPVERLGAANDRPAA